ncbi:filamentous hemagglutinin family protein, partial [Achromobacter sp.]|uniref:filamentous haemagglutinin family protein n=1 Tax=Achromobacter sp. TaxID=134375 RepID=UPI002F95D1C1
HDGAERGTLTLNAPRTGVTSGDMLIDAGGALDIQGARAIVVNAMRRETALPQDNDAAGGKPYSYIDQAYLDARHGESATFMLNALGNSHLLGVKLAGLNNARYRDALHLRPGLEVAVEGDLVVRGDLDLSRYRYDSLNPASVRTGVYGSGESGFLTLRAGGDLNIYGSINDGFAPPPATPDDGGWVLKSGPLGFGADVVLPSGGVELADGSLFPAKRALNYDLPIKNFTVAAGVQVPVEVTLNAPLTVPANTVLGGPVLAADGTVLLAAGTLLADAVTVPAGARLGAGFVAPAPASLLAMVWPAGVPLVANATLNGPLTLKVGALLPSTMTVKLPGNPMAMPVRPGGPGLNTGNNWAVASMLPAGSESWSLRVVAGADTQAADSRLLRPRDESGNLVLADTHYTVFDKHEITLIPGTPDQYAGLWYCDEACVQSFGNRDPRIKLGEPVPAEYESYCGPGVCQRVRYVWTQYGKDVWDWQLGFEVVVGTPITEDWADFICEDNILSCTGLGAVTPGTPPQEVVGRLLDKQLASPALSVLRTGTGDLEVLAGGDVRMKSPFGVYTAGTQAADVAPAFQRPRNTFESENTVLGKDATGYEPLVAGASSAYRAWYPQAGGNLLVRAGGDLTGDIWSQGSYIDDGHRFSQRPNADPANWLWRQADASGSAWWINFGTYVRGNDAPYLVGFTGFGTLGGGDLRVDVGGDAGTLMRLGGETREWNNVMNPRSQGLVLAVGATGRVDAAGTLRQTGGGDMDVRVGGGLNPNHTAHMGLNGDQYEASHMALNGMAANLRGRANINAGVQGTIQRQFGPYSIRQDNQDSRAYDPFTSTQAMAGGGLVLMPGDSVFNLQARGDLVLGAVRDAGRLTPVDAFNDQTPGWFSLWTPSTAIHLYSAGGNLTPGTQLADRSGTGAITPTVGLTGTSFFYPSVLTAIAPSGSIYMGLSAARGINTARSHSIVLAPSANSTLELLAGASIYAGGYAINRSGADRSTLATPFAPGLPDVKEAGTYGLGNDLFAHGGNTVTAIQAMAPAQFYANTGDIVGLRVGEIVTFGPGRMGGVKWYANAGPVHMEAGRDIVSSGIPLGTQQLVDGLYSTDTSATTSGNIFTHGAATDISVVRAGRDIIHGNFSVAGPGVLEVSAGRNFRAEDVGNLASLGPVVAGDSRPGASIALLAGAGAKGADYAGLLAYYLNASKVADPGLPLTDQGKPFRHYEAELLLWLTQRYGFAGDAQEARAYFGALAPEQQRVFARQVYFAELRDGGREYNDRASPREGSYLRGRQAIAALFPVAGADGLPNVYRGDVTVYGGAGLHTNFGGDIQVLTPGGQQVYGVEGAAPPATAGVITQGAGDISLYAQNSILLGQSRIMTTFGGGILAWSAAGDINAGRGSKTTVVYTPPKRAYDALGNITLSPSVPSAGAGIATLAPLPEVPAGDVDLYAPLGTIDAGEAGIRVSGNVNIAALQVVNAANIQVKGDSAGVPVTASVNTGALTSASATAASAVSTAQESAQRSQNQARQNQPSIINVQILGFGAEPVSGAVTTPQKDSPAGNASAYRPDNMVQVVGNGALSAAQLDTLTSDERTAFGL